MCVCVFVFVCVCVCVCVCVFCLRGLARMFVLFVVNDTVIRNMPTY